MSKKEIIDFEIDPLWKVSEMRELLRKHDILKPVPTHQTLINYIVEGTLDGFQSDKGFYLVRQKSMVNWIKSLQQRT
jgi:hypothetical protein